MRTIRQQIHNNLVALISLAVAVGALGYNTWRNETTEEQRNIRHASFRVLENLGDLQEVVDMRHYYFPFETASGQEGQLRVQGFGSLGMIRDLMMLMPEPAPSAGEALYQDWQRQFGDLDVLDAAGKHTAAATEAEEMLTLRIRQSREAVLQVLKDLE